MNWCPESPVLLADFYRIHVNVICEPPLLLGKLKVVSAHLALHHAAVLREGPVFETIATLPLHTIVCVLELVPELYSDLIVLESELQCASSTRYSRGVYTHMDLPAPCVDDNSSPAAISLSRIRQSHHVRE